MNLELPLLQRIDIASPCHASWEAMEGDERVRFCRHCRLSVYNLSELTASEAEKLVRSHEGRLCVRFYRRPDGTMLTRDCPVGLRSLQRRLIRAAAGITGLLAAVVVGPVLAAVAPRWLVESMRLPAGLLSRWADPEPQVFMGAAPLMGGIYVPPIPTPPGSPPPPPGGETFSAQEASK
jgi:hypothetical protein